MTIKQSRYITADTTVKKDMAIRTTELDKVKDDPFVRKSEVQQTVNNSTLPVSSRAVKSAINSIEIPSLDGYATEDYVDEELESVDSRIDLIDEKATEAKAGADRAEQAVGDTVGTGKIMREGAGGLLRSVRAVRDVLDFDQYSEGLSSRTVVNIENRPTNSNGNIIVLGSGGNYGSIIYAGLDQELHINAMSGVFKGWVKFYSTKNTRTDKNNVLHSGAGTPLNTLNVSDMAQDVVNRDDMTVTSGAVFRAIKQLTDQITSLEARVRELEDGGI